MLVLCFFLASVSSSGLYLSVIYLQDSCEIWRSPGQTVIASLAFHPKVKLLLIATYKDIYFWDWNASIMLGQTSTDNEEEKIRSANFPRRLLYLLVFISILCCWQVCEIRLNWR